MGGLATVMNVEIILARLYITFQTYPVWSVGWPPTCKSFIDLQMISNDIGESSIW